MPSLYVGRPFVDLIREEKQRLEQQAAEKRGIEDGEVYVSEKEALKSLLSDDAKRRLRQRGGEVPA